MMGLIKNIKNLLLRSTGIKRDMQLDSRPATPSADMISDYLDLTVDVPTGLRIATVYRCVELLSSTVGQLPMTYEKQSSGIYLPTSELGVNYLLNVQSTPTMSSYELKCKTVSEILLEGNAYIVPVMGVTSMDYERFVLCSRGTVTHDTANDKYYINDPLNGIAGVYDEDEIIHIKGMTGYNHKVGQSVLGYARSTIDIAGAGDAETLKRFIKGGNMRGILKNAMTGRGLDEYDSAELDKVSAYMEEKLSRPFSVVAAPTDTTFEQLSMTSTDMQFLETRKFALRDICRFFGVHPSFVFDDTSNNYKSAEMANVAFLSNTLNPLLVKIETEFQRKLIGRHSWGRRRITFDRQSIYALDLDSKVKYYQNMIGAGAMTVNDVRALENRPRVEDGDKVFVSANLKAIDGSDQVTPQTKREDDMETKNREAREVKLMGVSAGHVQVRENEDGTPSRVIEGYAIVFGQPSEIMGRENGKQVIETIDRSAVTQELLDRSNIRMTMYHDMGRLLARSKQGQGTLSYEIDEKGVKFRFEAPSTVYGDEALELVRRGDIDGCSFMFATRYGSKDCVERSSDSDRITYTVKRILALYDFTLTPNPAYPQTECALRRREIDEQEDLGVSAQIAAMRETAKNIIK